MNFLNWFGSSLIKPTAARSDEDKLWYSLATIGFTTLLSTFTFGVIFASGLGAIASWLGTRIGGLLDWFTGGSQYAQLGSQLATIFAIHQTGYVFGRLFFAILIAVFLVNLATVLGGFTAGRGIYGNTDFSLSQAFNFYGRFYPWLFILYLSAFVLAFASFGLGLVLILLATALWKFLVWFVILSQPISREKIDAFWLKLLGLIVNGIIFMIANGIVAFFLINAISGLLKH